MAARPTLPPEDRDGETADESAQSAVGDVKDPLAIARGGLIEVDEAMQEKRRRFGRRKAPAQDVTDAGAPEARVVDPFAVFAESLDEPEVVKPGAVDPLAILTRSLDAASAAEPSSAPVSVDDLPEPPMDEVFTETPQAKRTASAHVKRTTPASESGAIVPGARAADVTPATTSISAAAVRGTFPRRAKATDQQKSGRSETTGTPAPAARTQGSSSKLAQAEHALGEAETRTAATQQQVREAERAVQEATERAVAAERRASDAEDAAARAQELADEQAKRLAELQVERDGAISREARLHEEFEALVLAEAEARQRAEELVLESSIANARARAEAKARAEAEAAARAHADALVRAEDQLGEAQKLVAQAEQSSENARALAMQAADQIVAVAAQRLKTETARRAAAEARAEAAEAELRASAARILAAAKARDEAEAQARRAEADQAEREATLAAQREADALALREAEQKAEQSAAADAAEQARVEAARAERASKREEAVAALDAINNAMHQPKADDAVTDEWSFDELETAGWAVPTVSVQEVKEPSTDHPREAEGEMDQSQSESGRRGRFHLKRHKGGPALGLEAAGDSGRTPVETLADYVAAQGIDVPEELRQQAPVEPEPDAVEVATPEAPIEESAAEPTIAAEPSPAVVAAQDLPAAPTDDLWSEPDSDDSEDKQKAHSSHRPRGLLRRRGAAAHEPVDGPVDLEPDVTGTMEPAEAPATVASEESTEHPAHEEQQVSEEATTNEQSEDHVWTAAELAAEGWTTADLKGAGWTDAHLESIGWPLDGQDDAKTEDPTPAADEAPAEEAPATDEPSEGTTEEADDAAHAPAEPETTTEEPETEPEAAVEPEKAEEAVPTADEDEDEEPTLPGLEATGAANTKTEDEAPAEVDATEDEEPSAAESQAAEQADAQPEEEPEAEQPSEEADKVEEASTPVEETASEPEPVAEPEPEPVAAPPEPAPVAAAEPEPVAAPAEPEPAPTSVPAAAVTALTMQDLTPDEIERALMLGESLSEILARKNAALHASAAAAVPASAVSPATASAAAASEPSGSEPSPEHSTSASGGGDRGGDDSDDPDPEPAVAPVEPEPVAVAEPEPVAQPEPATVAAPETSFQPEPELEPWTEAHTTVLPKIVDEPVAEPLAAQALDSTSATRGASQLIASEAATETGATDVERIEYRPGNGRRYLFGTAFIAAAVLSVVAVFWAIQNPGIAPSVTAGCLVVLTGALWWSLMAWSPRIIAIGHGVLEFAQGGHVERFNLLDPETNIAIGADPTSRTWRAEVVRTNGTKIVVRPDDVRPQQFSALVAKYREEANASRR